MTLDVVSGKIRPLLDGPFSEGGATLSPDARWMAYASDVWGRFEVYVSPKQRAPPALPTVVRSSSIDDGLGAEALPPSAARR